MQSITKVRNTSSSVHKHIDFKSNKTLNEISEFLSIPVSSLEEPFFITDSDLKILQVNNSVLELLNISEKEVINKSLMDFDTELSRLGAEKFWKKLEKESSIELNSFISIPEGSFVPTKSIYSKFLHKNNDYGLIRIKDNKLKSIPDKKEVFGDKSLRNALRLAKMGNWEFDLLNNKIYWSEELYDVFDLNPSIEVSTIDQILSFIHGEDKQLQKESLEAAVFDGTDYNIDIKIILSDNKYKTLNSIANVVKSSEGKPIRVLGLFIDITDRVSKVSASNYSDISEGDYQIIFDNLQEGTIVLDSNARIICNNKPSNSLLWLNSAYNLKKGFMLEDALKERDIVEFKKHFQRCLKGEVIHLTKSVEYDSINKFWYEVKYAPVRDKENNVVAVNLTSSDITEQINTEKRFNNEKNKVQRAFNNLAQGVLLMDYNGDISIFNGKASALLRIITDHPIKKGDNIFSFFSEKNNMSFENSFNRALRGEKVKSEIKLEVQRGKEKDDLWVQSSFLPVGKGEFESKEVILTLTEITDKKSFEDNGDGLGKILNESVNEIYIFSPDSFELQYANKGALENSGYNLSELTAVSFNDLQKDMDASLLQEFSKILRKGKRNKIDYLTEHRRKNGSYYSAQVLLHLSQFKNEEAIVAIVVDTSERKRAEKELKESQKTLSDAQALAHVGSWELHINENKIDWSDELFRMYGFQPQEFKPSKEALTKNITLGRDLMERFLSYPIPSLDHGFYTEIFDNKGDKKVFFNKVVVREGDFSADKKIVGIIQDVTETKKAEEKVRLSLRKLAVQRKLAEENEKRLNSIIEGAVDGIIIVNKDLVIESLNSAAKSILHLDSNEVYLKLNEILPLSEDQIFSTSTIDESELEVIVKEEKVVLDYSISRLQLEEGDVYSIFIRDITQKKKMEKQIWEQEAKQKHQLEEEVAKRTLELQEEKIKVEKIHKDLISSMTYASKIQSSILPDLGQMASSVDDFFVFYQPRDLVSGDFYWFGSLHGKAIMAAVDCTGHGIPGAFMSMIGYTILNEIVYDKNVTSPDVILNEMHNGIRKVLRQDFTSNKDGMDISICVIDKRNSILEFAGAKNPLVYIQNNEMKVIKGNREPIGGEHHKSDHTFNKHIVPLTTETTCYLYSDGYQDQFGGEKNRKFMSKNFRNLLFEIHQHPMEEQNRLLASKLKGWMGSYKQIDDILVIGFKI